MANSINNRFGDYNKALNNGKDVLTKFLSLEEQKEIYDYFTKKTHFFGGFDDAERNRCLISNDDVELNNDIFDIKIIEAHYHKKYANITHRHVLGTIYSLGLDRSTYGDIKISDDTITIFTTSEVVDFLINNLKEILHEKLEFKIINNYHNINIVEKTVILNVASMRLDAIISKGCNMSRNDSSDIIKSGNVMVNHLVTTNINYQVKENDLLSIRHFGRITIKRIIGLSKKDRINIEVLINK